MSAARLDNAGEQAIDWMVRLRAAAPGPELLARFETWLAADPSHRQAWARLQQRLGAPYETLRALDRRLPGQAAEAREALLAPRRREVLRGLVGFGLFGGGLWLASRSDSGRVLLADLQTGTGERRRFALNDGSVVTLNAGSAADVEFAGGERRLLLRRGELVVDVAADPARPFIVRTAQGEARALGTRFLVRRERETTRVLVLEHAVRVSVSGATLDLRAGEAALLGEGIVPLGRSEMHRADWLDGRLSVLDEPLSAVIDALRPYRRGLIRVDPAIGALRVQGVFPLDDSDRALAALAETLPVRVERYGPWLTLLGSR